MNSRGINMRQLIFIMFTLFILNAMTVLAQVPPTAVAPVVAAPNFLQDFLNSHGGPMGAFILIIYTLNTLLSAIREILYKWDGVTADDPLTMEKFKVLSLVNKACLVVGKLIDYATGNTQHK